MSEQLKFIVQELNKAPFSMKFNLISFDSLKSEKLLQIMNDTFSEIDSNFKCDIRDEDPAELAIKNIEFLRHLKYKPDNTDIKSLLFPYDQFLPIRNEFRQGMVIGSKQVIYHILEWTLQRLQDLKKRAYLAKYLTKIDIPNDVICDADVSELYTQVENMIERFKYSHKENEQLTKSKGQTDDIMQDIRTMEHEKEKLMKQVGKQKRKTESFSSSVVKEMLTVVHDLRAEKDRELDLGKQKQELWNSIGFADQRINRLTRQLRDLHQAGIGTTPEGLIQKLEEEIQVNSYMVKDLLPKEIISLQKQTEDLQKVASEQSITQSDLNELNSLIKSVNSEITQLIEKKMMRNDPIDNKVSMYKQQAAIINGRKNATVEKYKEVRAEYQALESELNEKKQEFKQYDGVAAINKTEFKNYVTQLRTKSNSYKKKRTELAELKAEYGVLSRTEEVLKVRGESIDQSLSIMEDQKGILGFRDTQENLEKVSSQKNELDQEKGRSLEEMSSLVKKFHAKIAEKKAKMAPMISELRSLRQNEKEMQTLHVQKKTSYDSFVLGLESKSSKLDSEVGNLRKDFNEKESRKYMLDILFALENKRIQIASDEAKFFGKQESGNKKSLREQLNKSIMEQESLSKTLREKQKTIREAHQTGMKQLNMWKDLQKLLECKQKCRERISHEYDTNMKMDPSGETLVFVFNDESVAGEDDLCIGVPLYRDLRPYSFLNSGVGEALLYMESPLTSFPRDGVFSHLIQRGRHDNTQFKERIVDGRF
ncbi:Intraflagellar transport protein 81 [Nymphon striatum]|nr:Intraflagellar transport protein 81 [Nymphon striatum]